MPNPRKPASEFVNQLRVKSTRSPGEMPDQFDVSEEWKQCSDLTIYEAAFWVRLKFDPRRHAYRSELDDAYHDHFMQHPGGYEAVVEKCEVILSAIRSGLIKTTKNVLTADGHLDDYQTYISKSDWLAWCENNGLHELLVRFGYKQGASDYTSRSEKQNAQDDAGDSFSESLNSTKLKQAILEREYRGCKRDIVTHWPDIRLQHGNDADGHQVLRYLKKVLDKANVPSLKTVQNNLSILRKEGAIP